MPITASHMHLKVRVDQEHSQPTMQQKRVKHRYLTFEHTPAYSVPDIFTSLRNVLDWM